MYMNFLLANLKKLRVGSIISPLFLVDYIISQTLKRKLNEKPGQEVKILDPACGSGIFLLEALRHMIEDYISLNPKVKRNSKKFRNKIKEIIENNIFGIDKDSNAISEAIFSIYINNY